jgi:hypothetical protein
MILTRKLAELETPQILGMHLAVQQSLVNEYHDLLPEQLIEKAAIRLVSLDDRSQRGTTLRGQSIFPRNVSRPVPSGKLPCVNGSESAYPYPSVCATVQEKSYPNFRWWKRPAYAMGGVG